ncbi:MAG: (Fe-S)-binding protein [Candidatus Helarchaeota archaeon]
MEEFIDPFLEIKVQKILRYLPRSDCGDCGFKDCLAFAKEILSNFTLVCPNLSPLEHELLFLLINYREFLYPLVRRYTKEKKAKPSTIVGLIRIGTPDRNAPIILTSNSLYEQSILNLLLKKAHSSCYLLALDTRGVSLGETLLKQQLSIYTIAQALKDARLSELVDHRFIILPRFGTYLKRPFEKISKWKIFPGPIHISELPIFLERIWYRRLFQLKSAELERILKLMPERNCGECGRPTCLNFILDLQQHKAQVEECPILSTTPYHYLRVWLENRFLPIRKYETGLMIDSDKCVGCGVCTVVCPVNQLLLEKSPNNIDSPPLFKIINGTAQIINFEECWRHKFLIPCQVCQNNCPFGAISFGPVPIYYEPTHSVRETSYE